MPVEQAHIDQAVAIAKEFGATRVIVFGSAAHSPETANDLDIACAGVPPRNFYRMAGHLMTSLPVPVDVVALEDNVHFARHVEATGRVVLGAESAPRVAEGAQLEG